MTPDTLLAYTALVAGIVLVALGLRSYVQALTRASLDRKVGK